MTILRSGVSVMVLSSKPSTEYGSQARLRLDAASAYAFIQFGLPADLHRGATVLSATLTVQQAETWATASRTLTARRVTQQWLASKINWNNKPDVGGVAHNVTQTTGPNLTAWEFDVTDDVQAFVDGTAKNYGWRIITTFAGAVPIRGFRAASGKPTLEVVYAYPPSKPTTLHPSAGAVSLAKPVLTWDSDTPAAVQVQVDPAANGALPAFDSGVVLSTSTQFDLAASSYPGLAANASTQWRVRIRNTAGIWSPWSQWVTFSRVLKPTLTITQPTGVVWESTPPINWTVTGGTQTAYIVSVAATTAPNVALYQTEKVPSALVEHTPSKPVFLKDGASYIVRVRVDDTVDRESTPGDPAYTSAAVTTTLDYDSGVAGVTWLDATQKTAGPWVDLTWSREVMPDGWSIVRDDEVIYVADSANDLLVSGNTYNIQDWTATPNREHVYRVAPIVNGRTSRRGPNATMTPEVTGVWLIDPNLNLSFSLGDASWPATPSEDADIFRPIGARAVVRQVTAIRGLEGAVTGVLSDYDDRTWDEQEADLRTMQGSPSSVLRFVAGDMNIPVTAGNFVSVPHEDMTPNRMLKQVSFEIWQVGELPFDADL